MTRVVITPEGLFIPKEELRGMGKIVLERRGHQFVIRPKSMVEATRGVVAADPDVTDNLIEEIELGGIWEDDGSET